MARFSRYYICFEKNLSSDHQWDDRQKRLASLFEKNDSIIFEQKAETKKVKDGETIKIIQTKHKIFNHEVYHLNINKNIIVMRFANDNEIDVEIGFKPQKAKDEPSCYVIIDNRDNVRTVAIQKRKRAFSNPDQVAKIIQTALDQAFMIDLISVKILPEFYPEDLFELWGKVQQHAMALRFGVPQMDHDEIVRKIEELKTKGKDYFDDSLMKSILQIALELKKNKYKYISTIMPEDKKTALYVDKDNVYIKNLITMSRALGEPVEIVTNDSGTFRCFVDSDEDNTDKIVQKEFDENLLDALFEDKDKKGLEITQKMKMNAELKLVEMVNDIKHISTEDDKVAAS